MIKIKYRGGFKYQLAESVNILAPELTTFQYPGNQFLRLTGKADNTEMCFGVGYAWDGPSGPMMDTKSAMVASLAHDAGAQISRNSPVWGIDIRDQFIEANNKLFHRLCLESGMWRFRANYALWVLRKVDAYADPKNKKRVMGAP
jgi:hypothetical protein